MEDFRSTGRPHLVLTQTQRPLYAASPYLQEFLLAGKIIPPLWPVVIIFGLISNTANIVVFVKAGARDNVTILLLSLAFSDFVFLLFISPTAFGWVLMAVVSSFTWPLDPGLVLYTLYWPAYTAYDLSTFVSVSLAVIRCACVAMPLRFKSFFTRSRTIKWVVFLVVFAVVLRLPVLTIHSIAWRTDQKTNISSLYLKATNNVYMSHINDILNRGFIIYISYTITVTCAVLLVVKLYQASKIRRSCTTRLPQPSDHELDKSANQVLSSKDLQVVKSVVLVCTIFILAQLPFVLQSTLRLMIPGFDVGQRLRNLFGIFTQMNSTCSYLNASLNIFVYYNYNSKFRSVLRSMLGFKTNI